MPAFTEHPPASVHHYRRCVGSFPTGVTVVTATHAGRPAGMTLNSFTSVSLDPLLVLVCLAHRTRTLEAVAAGGRFTVSILAGGQREIALAFAANGAAFPAEHVAAEPGGHLPVRDALGVLRCAVEHIHRAGDHDLVLGRVEHFAREEGEPLVFHQGMFGRVEPAIKAA